jgi:hypothetical protein
MKLNTVFASLAVGTAVYFFSVPAHAQSIDPCTLYTCMAGISGSGLTGGPGCAPALVFWHAPTPAGLAVYVCGVFVPPASAAARMAYMETCQPGLAAPTNVAWLGAIMAAWGSTP